MLEKFYGTFLRSYFNYDWLEITNIRNINPKIPIRCLFNNGRVRSIAEISKNIHVQEYVDSTGIIEKIAPMNQS